MKSLLADDDDDDANGEDADILSPASQASQASSIRQRNTFGASDDEDE